MVLVAALLLSTKHPAGVYEPYELSELKVQPYKQKNEAIPKSHLFQKTPPSLRATSSINRGGAGDSFQR